MAESNVVELKKTVNPISTVSLAEHSRREFVAYVPHGTKFEDVLDPGFWAHVAESFEPFCTYVDVTAEDKSWVARLLVTGCDRNWAQMFTIYHHDFTGKEVAPSAESEFKVNHAPSHKWRFLRKSDNEVIKKGFETKADAQRALREYENTIK